MRNTEIYRRKIIENANRDYLEKETKYAIITGSLACIMIWRLGHEFLKLHPCDFLLWRMTPVDEQLYN